MGAAYRVPMMNQLLKSVFGSHYQHLQALFQRGPAFDTDPVCGMSVGTAPAGGAREFQGTTYYFCSSGCKTRFDRDPARYVPLRAADTFPTDPSGLPACLPSDVVELTDGATFDLRITPIAKRIGDSTVRMVAYNGSIPGPTLKVRQGSEVRINVLNQGDLDATVHWHGVRVENQYDGTHSTQAPIGVGGTFSYRVRFPDAGLYWYHPHTREDYGQEMGLYGNILVVPSTPDYWPPVNREIVLTLDDILLEGGAIAPFSRTGTTHVAMGRYGNVLLVSGDPDLSLTAQAGEVVRFYLTNTANARVFNVGIDGGRMKVVGGDSGRCEHEAFVDDVILAPSERVVVDVLFDRAGTATLEHHTPDRCYRLAAITVGVDRVTPSYAAEFETPRQNADMVNERSRIAAFLDAPPARTIAFVAEMNMSAPAGGAVVYSCPMDPEVIGKEGDRCPKCFMKLLPSLAEDTDAVHASLPHAHRSGSREQSGGIEWEDDMVDINRITTPANTRWKLVDRTSGAENHAIDWRFKVGDQVKIRLVNEMDSDHPMHHPFHIHGAGRFLVVSRDGVVEPNLVWKDTVLVRTGQTVDILLDVSNPGVWMAHCHIAEHHESGMMFCFTVTP